MPPVSITELTDPDDIRRVYPIMSELYLHLDEATYLAHVEALRGEGYRLFALKVDETIVALAGFTILHDFYLARHLWLRDLVTTYDERSKGYGARLLAFVEDFARREGCDKIALLSGLSRTGAHHFYEEHCGYRRLAYAFEKDL